MAMEVTGVNQYVNMAPTQPVERVNEVTQTGVAEDRDKVSSARQAPAQSQDRVQLSSQSREVDLASRVNMQQEDFRTEKVEQLQQSIESGTYRVQPEDLAEKMMGEIW